MKKKLKIKLKKLETPEEAYKRGYKDATIKYLQEENEKLECLRAYSINCAALIPQCGNQLIF